MPISLFVRDCMRKNPLKISADASIYEAIELMLDNRITGVTVVDTANNVVGVLSELDCMQHSINSAYNEGNVNSGLVSDYMSRTVDSCRPDDDILSVAELMLSKRQRRRPVVENGKLVGQLSCRNILWAAGNFTLEHQK